MSGHDERVRRHDEHGRHGGDDEHEQHAGNGTVNHGPSENSGPQESGHSDTEGSPPGSSPGAPSDDTSSTTRPHNNAPDPPRDGTPGDSTPEDGTPQADTPHAGDAPDEAASDDSGTESAGPEPEGAGGLGADEPGVHGAGAGADADADAGAGGAGADGVGPDVFGSDELALRRLLHQAVEEIGPTDGTLDHLRRAVPARRARKRQAVVGMAAAALFIGTAVPALVHVSNSTDSKADPAVAGHASPTQGGTNEGKEASVGGGSGDSSGSSKGSDKGDKKDEPGKGKGSDGGKTDVEPSASTNGTATCAPAQLAASSAGAGAPDGAGAVYGTFTITNVSAASCTVVGGGSVSPAALGAADPGKLGTVVHTAGDAAAGLPDPSTYSSSLVLPPGAAYSVKFAWVPSETCPTEGGDGGQDPSPDPSPTENPTGDSGGSSSEGASSGADPQLMKTDGTVDGSVSVSYAAEGGAPSTSTTVSNACAGTVFRTGILAGS